MFTRYGASYRYILTEHMNRITGYSLFKTCREYTPAGSTSASLRLTVLNKEYPVHTS